MPAQHHLNLPIGKALVKLSAIMASVLQYSNMTSLRETLSFFFFLFFFGRDGHSLHKCNDNNLKET